MRRVSESIIYSMKPPIPQILKAFREPSESMRNAQRAYLIPGRGEARFYIVENLEVPGKHDLFPNCYQSHVAWQLKVEPADVSHSKACLEGVVRRKYSCLKSAKTYDTKIIVPLPKAVFHSILEKGTLNLDDPEIGPLSIRF